MPKTANFDKPEACGQTVLPDRSVFIGQKLLENAKIKHRKCDILSDLQILCILLMSYKGCSLRSQSLNETFHLIFKQRGDMCAKVYPTVYRNLQVVLITLGVISSQRRRRT